MGMHTQICQCVSQERDHTESVKGGDAYYWREATERGKGYLILPGEGDACWSMHHCGSDATRGEGRFRRRGCMLKHALWEQHHKREKTAQNCQMEGMHAGACIMEVMP
jgi:hypothetical protein